jgi:adenosine deaminase CECR1
MSTANSNEKKRKRSSRSLRSSSRIAPKMVNAQAPQPEANLERKEPRALLDRFFADEDHNKKHAQTNRDGLLRAETVDAWDSSAITNPSQFETKAATEKTAATIVKVLRKFERSELFGNTPSEAIPEDWTLDMGGQFLTNKERIEERSELFKISKEVPKGALLHLHFNAELNPEMLLVAARGMPNMYVWSIRSLQTQKDLDVTEMQFKIMPASTKSNNIFDGQYMSGLSESDGKKITPIETIGKQKFNDYKDRVWMRWNDFRECFNEKFGNFYEQSQKEKDDNQRSRTVNQRFQTCSDPSEIELEPAENWMMRKMVLSAEEAYAPEQTVNG